MVSHISPRIFPTILPSRALLRTLTLILPVLCSLQRTRRLKGPEPNATFSCLPHSPSFLYQLPCHHFSAWLIPREIHAQIMSSPPPAPSLPSSKSIHGIPTTTQIPLPTPPDSLRSPSPNLAHSPSIPGLPLPRTTSSSDTRMSVQFPLPSHATAPNLSNESVMEPSPDNVRPRFHSSLSRTSIRPEPNPLNHRSLANCSHCARKLNQSFRASALAQGVRPLPAEVAVWVWQAKQARRRRREQLLV